MKHIRTENKTSRAVRATAMLLVSLLCAALLLPMHVSAAESGKCGDNLTWTYDGGRLTISGTGEMTNFFDNNMPPWYSHAKEITSAVVGEGVTTLGELAFYECNSLSNVVLPSTLREIGIRAFKDCTSLSYVNLPGGLYFIAESAFENCSSLNGIRLEEGVTVVGDKAFYRCSSLTSIIIPSSVNYLGMVVFAYCESLIRAEIRCPIEKLPDWTFYACNNLTSVSFPDTLKSVGSLAFFDCPSISGVYYYGDYMDEIYESIRHDNNAISSNGGIMADDIGTSSGKVTENTDHSEATYTSVSETDHSIITVEEVVSQNMEEGAAPTTTVKEENVSATIISDKGWDELSDIISEMIEQNEEISSESGGAGFGGADDGAGLTVNVAVQLPDTTVSGSFLYEFAEQNVTFDFTTDDGSAWQIDMSQVTKDQIDADATYDLSYSLSDVEEKLEGVASGTVFKLSFSEDYDFNVKVKVKLGLTYAGRYATLYQKNGSKFEEVHNVWIDGNGNAWFYLASIDEGTDYYIGIDVEGVTRENSVIPPTMYGSYGPGELSDSAGNLYKITGRTSRWGITGGQFALYVGVAIGFLILVVSIIMISRNHIIKTRAAAKMRAGAGNGGDEEEVDDLQLKILREMLEESKAKDEDPKK